MITSHVSECIGQQCSVTRRCIATVHAARDTALCCAIHVLGFTVFVKGTRFFDRLLNPLLAGHGFFVDVDNARICIF
jgi:hypothetical protein